jgi:hypothetical protein
MDQRIDAERGTFGRECQKTPVIITFALERVAEVSITNGQ